MSKPDDIPQNEWDAAFAEMDCHCSEAMMGDDGLQQAVHTAIARAIMAAEKRGEEREREACAQIADAETLTGTPPAGASDHMVFVIKTTVEMTGKTVAAAIRKRGEG